MLLLFLQYQQYHCQEHFEHFQDMILSLSLLVTIVQVDPSGKVYNVQLAKEEAASNMGVDTNLQLYLPGRTAISVDSAALAAMDYRFGLIEDQGTDGQGQTRGTPMSNPGQGSPPPNDDEDNDLTVNSADNCPFTANENQANSDSDSLNTHQRAIAGPNCTGSGSRSFSCVLKNFEKF